MTLRRRGTMLDRQLRAEVRRILLLLERTRSTRRRARVLIALETAGSRRGAASKAGRQLR